jgi:hypothetical protein
VLYQVALLFAGARRAGPGAPKHRADDIAALSLPLMSRS